MSLDFNSGFGQGPTGFATPNGAPTARAGPTIPAVPAFAAPQHQAFVFQNQASVSQDQASVSQDQASVSQPQPFVSEQQKLQPPGHPQQQQQHWHQQHWRHQQQQQQQQQQNEKPTPARWVCWSQFLRRHDFLDVWLKGLPTGAERDNYSNLRARITAWDEACLAREKLLIDQRDYWINISSNHHTIPQTFTNALNTISNVAREVEQSWAKKENDHQKHAKFLIDNKSGHQPDRYKVVGHVDFTGQGAHYVLVGGTLQGSRYYLGHNGGDFIFQYSNQPPLGSHCPFLGFEQAHQTFQYRGQVPRPQSEYIDRLQEVIPCVLRVLSSILGYHNKVGHLTLPCPIQRISRKNSKVNRFDAKHLHDIWVKVFPTGHEPRGLKPVARANPIVEEFAYLVVACLKGPKGEALKFELRPLIHCVESMSGSTLLNLAKAREARLLSIAREQLFAGTDADMCNLLIFQDDSVQDIHQFYNQPQYLDDPLHADYPAERVDVSPALRISRDLRRQGWGNDPSLFFVAPSDLELQPEPQPDLEPQPTPSQEIELNDAPSDLELYNELSKLIEADTPEAVQNVIAVANE
ncbi:hypothetical protein QQX98_011248 [Neonectria punicea]|uniref:Uncharacterized protein n=1 Tax=Neonectria punicea TaxID=979145 RepID=A0ABR1GMK8_9HYPO